MELYRKYRPTDFDSIIGQPEAVKVLKQMEKRKAFPHAIMLTGASGCGKTTIARIIRSKLNCGEMDWNELNCADFRGIDMIRDIRSRYMIAPVSSCRIWLIDEAHQLTKDAQNGFLKMLEDTPKHVYFMLATTDPGKLLRTIQTRCTEIKVKPLTPTQLASLVASVVQKEVDSKDYPPDEVIEKIAELAEGSARKALVLLEQVLYLDTADEQIDALEKSDYKSQSIELCRCLINPRAKFADAAKILKGLEEEPETIRRMILGYFTNVLLSGGKMAGRAYMVVQAFRDNFFDCGKAGLAAACYEILEQK
jgi:DNA polymerase III gamma/tau subunit